MMLPFVIDLLRDPKLQRQFQKNPEAVARMRGVSEKEFELAAKGDPKEVLAALERELHALVYTRGKSDSTMMVPWPCAIGFRDDLLRDARAGAAQPVDVAPRLPGRPGLTDHD